MQIEGRVGSISAGVGSVNVLTTCTDGSLLVKCVPGRYRPAAIAGTLFSIANQTPIATSQSLDLSWTGLFVLNPKDSGRNIIIHEFGWGADDVDANAAVVGIATTYADDLIPSLTAVPVMHNTGAASAKCGESGMLIAPVLNRVYGTVGKQVKSGSRGVFHIDGSLVLPQGRAVMSYTSKALMARMIFYFLWEEVSVC